ncbi:hypothetical protein FSP39_019137 [Pinctada imbricata]|uniref:BHLH domain-containing protein n=1 Tax=Pinctada imbricata TaxID=66713 RepID=A0AA89C858_PINIB|nr:hypothetical protein FSP39_019137 [Pinctada imbricata]
MVQMKSKLSRRQSPTQSVAKKHLKMHLKRIRNREYSRLRDMVPSIATKDKVSKVTVIEEAVKYIDELHKALFERLQSKGLQNAPSSEDDVKDFIQNMMPPNLFSRTDSTPCQFEKQQRVPSYLLQRKHKGSSK